MFYCAARQRSEGAEAECQVGTVRSASLENPIVEIEWYLAQAEAKQAAADKSK